MIRFLKRDQIDIERWNQLMGSTSNGLVYARSEFLDKLSPDWCALASSDYESLMPLTQRIKYGIRYLYQPPYLQQLGVFGVVNEDVIARFISSAQEHFTFAEIHLNYSNSYAGTTAKQNFILSLNRSYDELAGGFSTAHLKNFRRGTNAGLRYVNSRAFGSNVKLNRRLYGSKLSSVKSYQYDAIVDLAEQAPDHMLCREVWKDEELQASCVCFIDKSRIYFIISSVTETGKHNQANHFLVDQLIREFAGKNIILDFEGSDIPGIAEFYKGFGAKNQPYYFLKWNHLPWPIKLFKK